MKRFVIFMLFSVPVWAVPLSREADAYFEAKNYGKAIEYYEKMAQEPSLQSWQKGIVQYNIAVSQVASGAWNDALRTLYQIQTTSPYVLMHVQATLAYIHLHLAQSQGVKDDPTTLNWLRDALREVDDASKTYCRLQKLEGSEKCKPSDAIQALRNQIEKQWSLFSDEGIGLIDPLETRLYMEEARHWLMKAHRLSNQDRDPFTTLKNAVEDQEHALSINRLYRQIQNPTQEMYAVIHHAQKETLKTAEPFYSEVLEKEIKEYPEHCQCHPWDQVIPSFEEGYKRAKWMVPIMDVQEEILRYWKLTQENVTKQEKPPIKPSEEPAPSTASIKDVISEIEEMDHDDRVPKQKIPVSSEGTKPW